MGKRRVLGEADFPEPGSVFIGPTGDGRWAAGRVLRREVHGGAMGVLVAGSRWIGREPPSLDRPELREPLILTHHRHAGQAEIFWAHDPMPAGFQLLGRMTLSNEDRAATSGSFGGWPSVPLQAMKQWRWDHDREALLRDEAIEAAAESERRKAAAARRAESPRSVTLDALAERDWLESWTSPSLAERRDEARRLLRHLVGELRASERRTKPGVRKLLKQTVETLNRLDARARFITTVEREDLCEALEQIVSAAGFAPMADEIDRWREW